MRCSHCGGLRTGTVGRCGICTWREHLGRFRDARNTREWLAFQRCLMDDLRERSVNMRLLNIDTSGICFLCQRPMDDHALTYANAAYPVPICPPAITPPVPVPAEYPPDYLWE